MRASNLLVLAYLWAGAGIAPPAWALEATETQHDVRAKAGDATTFGGVYSSVQKCTPVESFKVTLEQAPRLGRFEARRSTHPPTNTNIVAVEKCKVTGVRGLDFVYRAAPGAQGEDTFAFVVHGSDGSVRRHVVNVTVN